MSLLETIKRHPLRSISLVSFVVIGAGLGLTFLPEEMGVTRRVLGGGLLGGLAWLIPSFGGLIDER